MGTETVLLDKIFDARSMDGAPPTDRMVPYPNIGALMAEQTENHEEKSFLIFHAEEGTRKEFSYREFFEAACQTANFLVARGVRKGERVAVVSHNHCDAVIQYFACFLCGAVVVPVNVQEDEQRLAYILHQSCAVLALVRHEYLPRVNALAASAPRLRSIVQVGGVPAPPVHHFHSDIASMPMTFRPSQPVTLDDEALIVYTSGTTGNPKAVVLDHYNLLVDAMAIAEWHQIADDQRMMCVLPIHHVNGIVVTLLTPLYAGAGVVLNQRFHPDNFFERIAAEKVSVVSVVPTILQFLLHARLSMEQYKLAHFRHIVCGAGPLTIDLVLKFEQMFKIPIVHGYGLSETTCYSCFLPIDLPAGEHKQWLSKNGFPAIGVPLPINDMAIHDSQGNELPEGERGEIVIRGHNVMKHYDSDDAANEAAFTHRWFRSGDEGFFLFDETQRRFFFITGRIKELIIRGGVNISPFEIDEVLTKMPGVAAGIAVGFDNDWYGEEVGAYVTLKPGAASDAATVLAHCRKHLSYAKAPKVVVFGTDVPVTSTGKYQRNKCKDLFAEWKTVQFSNEKG